MNRWLRVGTLWLALAAVLLPRLSVQAADDPVETDRLLPSEVAATVNAPHFSKEHRDAITAAYLRADT